MAAAASSGSDDEVRPASRPPPAALRRSSVRPRPQSELRLNASGALGRTSRPSTPPLRPPWPAAAQRCWMRAAAPQPSLPQLHSVTGPPPAPVAAMPPRLLRAAARGCGSSPATGAARASTSFAAASSAAQNAASTGGCGTLTVLGVWHVCRRRVPLLRWRRRAALRGSHVRRRLLVPRLVRPRCSMVMCIYRRYHTKILVSAVSSSEDTGEGSRYERYGEDTIWLISSGLYT